jgi:hypothetical protein
MFAFYLSKDCVRDTLGLTQAVHALGFQSGSFGFLIWEGEWSHVRISKAKARP